MPEGKSAVITGSSSEFRLWDPIHDDEFAAPAVCLASDNSASMTATAPAMVGGWTQQ